jgi:hypothetical protein
VSDTVQADTSFEVLDTCEIKIKENDNHRGARGGQDGRGGRMGADGGVGGQGGPGGARGGQGGQGGPGWARGGRGGQDMEGLPLCQARCRCNAKHVLFEDSR